MSKHLVFVGGGHAHLTSLKDLSSIRERGHRVTLISPSPYHYYSGMGSGSGIFWKKSWVWKSRLAFHLKDYIDRKFMRAFQVCGEREETFDGIE